MRAHGMRVGRNCIVIGRRVLKFNVQSKGNLKARPPIDGGYDLGRKLPHVSHSLLDVCRHAGRLVIGSFGFEA